MEKISTVFKKTHNVLREKMRNKRTGHRHDHNNAAEAGEEKTSSCSDTYGQKGAGIHPQSPCGHIIKSSSLVNMVNRGLKKCPVCSNILSRPMDSTGRPCPFSSCAYCSHTHHFCWSCSAPWVFPNAASSGQCGNRSCHIVATLLGCETVTDTGSSAVGCPVFRACPQCYTLTTPQSDCRYVACLQCTHRFCYICLDSETECVEAEGLDHSLACKKPRAERQKFIT